MCITPQVLLEGMLIFFLLVIAVYVIVRVATSAYYCSRYESFVKHMKKENANG